MSAPSSFRIVEDESRGVLVVSGSVEPSDVGELSNRLHVPAGADSLTVDLTAVTYLPSEAVSVLLLARMRARRAGARLRLHAEHGSVAHRVLVLMGLPVDEPRDVHGGTQPDAATDPAAADH